MTIQELLEITVKNNASDLHLLPGILPAIRVDGGLVYLNQYQPLTKEDVETMVFSLLSPEQKELFLNNKELDFSFGIGGGAYGNEGRFRTNIYHQRGVVTAAFRFLPPNVRGIEELHLPKVCHK